MGQRLARKTSCAFSCTASATAERLRTEHDAAIVAIIEPSESRRTPAPIVLVRPDGYIAWAGTDPDDDLQTALHQLGERRNTSALQPA